MVPTVSEVWQVAGVLMRRVGLQTLAGGVRPSRVSGTMRSRHEQGPSEAGERASRAKSIKTLGAAAKL